MQHIIAVSENLKQFLVKELQIKTPITVIHNGFDSEKFNLNKLDDTSNINKDFLDTKNRILCIARLDYQKNIPFLIDSFALIKEKLPESNLFILGHGEQIDDIKKKITSMELSNRVFLLGFRTNPEEYLKLSNLFVLSSRYESFGNVLVEALACGIPVLTTNYGEVVHEIMPTSDYGIVVEQGSTKHFSEAISDIVLKGTFDKNKIAKYAVENFDIRKIANQYVESIENEILTNKQALM